MRKLCFVAMVLSAVACQKSDNKASGSASGTASASASASASGTGGASASAVASGTGSASASASGTGDGTASASGTASGSGTADDGPAPSCADLVDLQMKIVMSTPGISDEDKQKMQSQRDGVIQQCNASPPPPELSKCFIKQTTMEGFEKCENDYQQAHKPPPPPLPAGLHRPTKDDLATFTKDIKGSGPLTATIETDKGTIHCELLGDKAPMTVANFVGLATGQLPWVDPKTKAVQTGKPFYDGLVFHRVVPGFMIQGGDPNGDGSGGPGYEFDNETTPDLVFDKPGVMAMANAGPDTNGSQFFIMDAPHPDLNGSYSIFGMCKDPDVVHAIASMPTGKTRPEYADTPVVIKKVSISK